MDKNNVKVAEAARMMGVSPQFVRIGLQKGIFPFGCAVKMSSEYTYYISRAKLMDFIGGKNDEHLCDSIH